MCRLSSCVHSLGVWIKAQALNLLVRLSASALLLYHNNRLINFLFAFQVRLNYCESPEEERSLAFDVITEEAFIIIP